jgi:Kef-type K+ transport system membrane component KefB
MLADLWPEIFGDAWFQIAFLLTTALIAYFIFRKLRLPKILGLIVLGIIVGPSMLGMVSLEEAGSFSLLGLLAEFGAIVVLFMIGLEFEIRDIYTRKNVFVAIGGIVLPWVGGYLLAEFMLPAPGDPFTKLNQSLFVGTALVATSVAISAAVLKEFGALSSRVGKTILGAAVVDDVIGMVVLAITTGVASGEGIDLEGLGKVSIAAILFVGAGAYLGAKFVTKVISAVERRGIEMGIEESGFMIAVAFAFLYAFISKSLGISAIVGAFIAGTSFSGCEYRKRFMQGIAFLEWAFAPLFFVSLGVLVDVRLPFSIWLFALALAAVAILSKVVGGGGPARMLGMSNRESISVGLGMSPRLEVAMVIALFGLNHEIITSRVYSVIVLTGLVTVLIAPALLRSIIWKSIEPPE